MIPILLAVLLGGCVSKTAVSRSAAQMDLGTAYYKEGKVELAIETLTTAAELDPQNWRARSNLAIAYIAKGEAHLAERSFRQALRIAPDEAEVLNNYATYLLSQGRADEALQRLRLALRDLDYRNPAVLYSNLAGALIAKGELEEAEKSAEEAVRRMPMLCDGYYQLARVQEAQKDVSAALDAYARLAQACPGSALDAKVKVGCLQLRSGHSDLGAALLEEVVVAARGTSSEREARVCLGSEDGRD